MTDHIITHRFHRWLQEAATFEQSWRKDNTTAFDFYDGVQWSAEETAVIEGRGHLAAVLNVIRPTVDMVMSLEADRRIDVQVVPRESSDDMMANLLTELLKQTYDYNDYDYYQSRGFFEAVVGGRGAVQARVKKDDAGQEQVLIEWVPWEQVYVDPFHRRPDASDARYIIRQVWLDRDVVEKRYPGKATELAQTFIDTDYESVEREAQTSGTSRAAVNYYDYKQQRIALNEVYYRDAAGKVRHVIFSDAVFFEGGPEEDAENKSPYEGNFYPIVPVYGFRTHRGAPKGLVSYLLDYQRMINKLNSKYLWNISSNRALIEDGAIQDPDEFREEWNRPDGVVMLNNGGLAKVRTEENLRECQYLSNHLNFLLMMVQRTSGINDSMIGVGGVNERSAQQQTVRITQGAAMQTQLFDNLFHARRQIATVVLNLIGETYTDRRIVRQVQPNGQSVYFEVNKPEVGEDGKPVLANAIGDVLKYDVILKPVPPFDTVKQNTMRMFSEVAKTGSLPPEIVGEIMLELSDLPNKADLIARMQKMMDAQQAAAQAQAQQEAAAAAAPTGGESGGAVAAG